MHKHQCGPYVPPSEALYIGHVAEAYRERHGHWVAEVVFAEPDQLAQMYKRQAYDPAIRNQIVNVPCNDPVCRSASGAAARSRCSRCRSDPEKERQEQRHCVQTLAEAEGQLERAKQVLQPKVTRLEEQAQLDLCKQHEEATMLRMLRHLQDTLSGGEWVKASEAFHGIFVWKEQKNGMSVPEIGGILCGLEVLSFQRKPSTEAFNEFITNFVFQHSELFQLRGYGTGLQISLIPASTANSQLLAHQGQATCGSCTAPVVWCDESAGAAEQSIPSSHVMVDCLDPGSKQFKSGEAYLVPLSAPGSSLAEGRNSTIADLKCNIFSISGIAVDSQRLLSDSGVVHITDSDRKFNVVQLLDATLINQIQFTDKAGQIAPGTLRGRQIVCPECSSKQLEPRLTLLVRQPLDPQQAAGLVAGSIQACTICQNLLSEPSLSYEVSMQAHMEEHSHRGLQVKWGTCGCGFHDSCIDYWYGKLYLLPVR